MSGGDKYNVMYSKETIASGQLPHHQKQQSNNFIGLLFSLLKMALFNLHPKGLHFEFVGTSCFSHYKHIQINTLFSFLSRPINQLGIQITAVKPGRLKLDV